MDMLELADRFAEHYTAVIADVMDQAGYGKQIMDGAIQGLTLQDRVAGLAFTCKGARATELEPDDWDERAAFLDALPNGSVAVLDSSDDTTAAHWGELMSTAARGRGCRGAVLDGGTRDVDKILEMGFPVFTRFRSPASSITRWRITGFDHPVHCGGVLVRPGDIIVGDADGVVVVPVEIAADTLKRVEEIASAEDAMREELLRGELFSTVYDRYQVG